MKPAYLRSATPATPAVAAVAPEPGLAAETVSRICNRPFKIS